MPPPPVPPTHERPTSTIDPAPGRASRWRWLLAAVAVLVLLNVGLWIVRVDILPPSWAEEHPTAGADAPGIGEEVTVGDLTMTVTSVEQGLPADDVTLDVRPADGEYAEIRLEVRTSTDGRTPRSRPTGRTTRTPMPSPPARPASSSSCTTWRRASSPTTSRSRRPSRDRAGRW
ncbi:MAG: hypothetical protein ACTHW7_06890 [Actinomycetaceae bacterium]